MLPRVLARGSCADADADSEDPQRGRKHSPGNGDSNSCLMPFGMDDYISLLFSYPSLLRTLCSIVRGTFLIDNLLRDPLCLCL